MPTCSVELTDHDDQLVDDLVTSGRFQNASEVLGAGLRLLGSRPARSRRSWLRSGCWRPKPSASWTGGRESPSTAKSSLHSS